LPLKKAIEKRVDPYFNYLSKESTGFIAEASKSGRQFNLVHYEQAFFPTDQNKGAWKPQNFTRKLKCNFKRIH
jgi:hypothetical protein